MEVDIKHDGSIYYRNGNKEYKFQNMGEFINVEERGYDAPSPIIYKLMAYNELQEDGILHIEALIDPHGNYSRFIVSKGLTERIVAINNGIILEDKVFVMPDNVSVTPKEIYYNHEDEADSDITFEEHFNGREKKFISDTGRFFKGEVIKDHHITDFIQKSSELSHNIHSPFEEDDEMKL